MGLDVSAYRQLTKTICGVPTCEFNINPCFPDRAIGVEAGVAYGWREYLSFCAGSRTGYWVWRDALAQMVGYEAMDYAMPTLEGPPQIKRLHAAGCWASKEGPFFELINFSDCVGTIGPIASAKLAKDFAQWDERARKTFDALDYAIFQTFRNAFEMAADRGAVSFR